MNRDTDDRDERARYEIRISTHLEPRWAAQLGGLSVRHEADGTSVLSGSIVDQAALYGLLQRVRDLGIPLVSVTRIEPDLPLAPGPKAG
jgi:hypothetical protein